MFWLCPRRGPTTKAEENFLLQSFDRIWTRPPFHFFCCTVVKSLVNYPKARIPAPWIYSRNQGDILSNVYFTSFFLPFVQAAFYFTAAVKFLISVKTWKEWEGECRSPTHFSHDSIFQQPTDADFQLILNGCQIMFDCFTFWFGWKLRGPKERLFRLKPKQQISPSCKWLIGWKGTPHY